MREGISRGRQSGCWLEFRQGIGERLDEFVGGKDGKRGGRFSIGFHGRLARVRGQDWPGNGGKFGRVRGGDRSGSGEEFVGRQGGRSIPTGRGGGI